MTLDDYLAWMSGGDVSGINARDKDTMALSAVGGGIQTGAQTFGGVSKILAGLNSKAAADFQAAQLDRNARTAAAIGTKDAESVQQRTDMIQSRALAVAAASGGGASDPGVVNIMARTAAEGAYQKAIALYNGEDRAAMLEAEANAKRYEGKTDRNNALVAGTMGVMGGATSLLQAKVRGASLLQRFGGDGPGQWADNGPGE